MVLNNFWYNKEWFVNYYYIWVIGLDDLCLVYCKGGKSVNLFVEVVKKNFKLVFVLIDDVWYSVIENYNKSYLKNKINLKVIGD